MVNKELIHTYKSKGLNLTLLEGKKPIVIDWTNKTLEDDVIFAHKGNLGWVIDANHLVIDVDPKNGGFESFERLKMALGLELVPTVTTPSGGYHIYTRLPAEWVGTKLLKNVKAYKGIDFLSSGTQCVIVGSVTEKGKYGFYDDFDEMDNIIETPLSILNIIKDNRIDPGSNVDDDNDDLSFLNKIDNTPAADVESMLNKLDPNCDYETWIKIGMGCHTWHKEKGFVLWDKWSQGGISYDADVCRKKWTDFNRNSKGEVTLGTIGYMAKEHDYETENDKLNNYIELIEKSLDYKEIELNIAQKIKKEKFDAINLEILIKKLQLKIKDLSGVAVPVKDVRNLLGKGKGKNNDDSIVEGTPDWCNDWIYISSLNAMWNLKEYQLESITSFNLTCGIHVPYKDDSESKPYAMKYISDNGFIRKVTQSVYMPITEEQLVIIDNREMVNIFNPESVPKEAGGYSDGGLQAIEMVKKHILFICNFDENNADILMQWIAHNVQYMGKKILWSPVIQGIQGIGKSYFSRLLRVCLGDDNVGTVSPTQVTSDFNSWAINKCVNVLEELRIHGQNRYECVNALKPLITDPVIQINTKGIKQYNGYNTTNYICLTNYKDAIPIEDGDRRWWVIFNEIENTNQILEIFNKDAGEYFNELFGNLDLFSDEIRKFFLEYKITDNFMNMKTAPMTDYKEVMISSQNSKHEGLEELKELIAAGGEFYNDNAVCPAELFTALSLEYDDLNITKNNRNFLLSKLGYLNLGKTFKIKGKVRRVWAKQPMTNEQVRLCFCSSDSFDDF